MTNYSYDAVPNAVSIVRNAVGDTTEPDVDLQTSASYTFEDASISMSGTRISLYSVPDAITNLAEDSWSGYDVIVTWSDPWDGGDTITGINIYIDDVFDQVVALGVQTATIPVSAGATVAITAKAENGIGVAPVSNTVTAISTFIDADIATSFNISVPAAADYKIATSFNL